MAYHNGGLGVSILSGFKRLRELKKKKKKKKKKKNFIQRRNAHHAGVPSHSRAWPSNGVRMPTPSLTYSASIILTQDIRVVAFLFCAQTFASRENWTRSSIVLHRLSLPLNRIFALGSVWRFTAF